MQPASQNEDQTEAATDIVTAAAERQEVTNRTLRERGLKLWHARSLDDGPESEWEPLLDHLRNVKGGAEKRGDKFRAGNVAAACGVLHDLGKYKPEFQAYLRGGPRPDHSSVGAAFARQRLNRTGLLIAHGVAGHHAGLQDGLFSKEGRLDRAATDIPSVVSNATTDGLALPESIATPEGFVPDKADLGFQLAILARMVFSCLIDADREAAASFTARGRLFHQQAANIIDLEAELAAYISGMGEGDKDINRIRRHVLREALAHHKDPRGIFTLTVPTGGGKTLTSLAFALAHARHHGLDRVIVVIPYTSIIEQAAEVYRAALGKLRDSVLEHHSAFDATKETGRHRLYTETWDRPIVVTTAVQFFESLFAARPSRCRKLHNIARSVVVVDEAQTMPLPLLRPCVAALKELQRNYGCSVVLSTATKPSLEAPSFHGGIINPVELAPDVPMLFTALRRTAVRYIGVQDDDSLAGMIGRSHRSLCIVNQRKHARDLYHKIRHLEGARHLSTRMHAAHRARVLAEIKADLRAVRPCRVVSTSLIEAGVDIDFPKVFRATAGLDQIAQAAGRCNREGGQSAEASEVLVFRAVNYPAPQALRPNAEAGMEALRLYADDPLSPDAIRAYFEMLYHRIGREALDARGVMEKCDESKVSLDFPFATIADDMRFVTDVEVPIIVPVEDDGRVAGLVDELRRADKIGDIARELQRYTVGIPTGTRADWIARGEAEVVREADFSDQFAVLRALGKYDRNMGLAIDH